KLPGILSSLSHSFSFIGEPSAALLDDSLFDAQVDEITFLGNSRPVQDVELSFPKGRSHFVLYDFDFGATAGYFVAVFDRSHASYVDTNRCIKLKCPPTRGSFWVAEHHPDFLSDLVDKNHAGLGLRNNPREFTKR